MTALHHELPIRESFPLSKSNYFKITTKQKLQYAGVHTPSLFFFLDININNNKFMRITSKKKKEK